MSSSTTNISSCGRCHSGSVRLALIGGQNPVALTNDLNVAITCVVCHDPHQTNSHPAQLRNPIFSTNYFSLSTSDVFTNKYTANTNINLCGQCHNSRGAAWADTSRAPHRSVQYNFLLGSVGQLWNGVTDSPAIFNPGTHAGLPSFVQPGAFYLTNQCVSCHMQSDTAPATAHSHTFEVDTDNVCLNCHLSDPGHSATGVSDDVSLVIDELNQWAATQAPAVLRSNGIVALGVHNARRIDLADQSDGIGDQLGAGRPGEFQRAERRRPGPDPGQHQKGPVRFISRGQRRQPRHAQLDFCPQPVVLG